MTMNLRSDNKFFEDEGWQPFLHGKNAFYAIS